MLRRALILALALLTLPAHPQAPLTPFSLDHPAMGTTFTLVVYASSQQQADDFGALAFDEIDRLEALLSNYQPLSELSRINASAANAPVTTDAETFRFLTEAQLWSRRSKGAFDITVGPLMRLWGFFRQRHTLPAPADLARVHRSVGWQHVLLDPSVRTVRFNAPGVELDPGGIGKGFAVDSAVALLRAHGVTAALLSAGSSTVYAIGSPPGQPGWRIRVPDPRVPGSSDPSSSSGAISTALLRDTSLSTAKCGDKRVVIRGRTFCHIMNPASGRPVQDMLSATIVDPSATASDAISNVLFVQGPTAGTAFLHTHRPAAAALILSGHGNAIRSCSAPNWSWPISSSPCTAQAGSHRADVK